MPLAGGLFDQPGPWLMRMEQVARADAEQASASVDEKAKAEERLAAKIHGIQGE